MTELRPASESVSASPAASRSWIVGGVLFGLLFPTLLTWLYFIVLSGSPAGLQQTTYGLGKTLQFVFPAVWVLLVLRCRPKRPESLRAGLLPGIAFGAAVFLVAFVAYHAWFKTHVLPAHLGDAVAAKVVGFGIRGFAGFVAMGVFYSVLHSLLEEYYWRWFVYGQLRRLTSAPTAIVASSLGFTAHHVLVLAIYFGWTSPTMWFFTASVAVGGAFWAWLYERSGSLVGPWVSHALIDAIIFTIGYDLAKAAL